MVKNRIYKIGSLFVLLFILNNLILAQSDSLVNHPQKKQSLYHLRELQYAKQMEDFDPLHKDINYPVLTGVGLSYAFIIYQINEYYKNTWWKEDSNYIYNGSFHIVNDSKYALGIDKIGHAYGSQVIAHFFSAGLLAANINDELAIWLGAAGGLGLQLYTEIQDGFAPIDKETGEPKWGFSPGDAIADVLGAGYYVARYYYPSLNNFQLRVSYWPSEAMRNGDKPDYNIADDYDGQKMWLAFRMKNLLPKSLAEYWPSFLMLSAGYGVTGVGDYHEDGPFPSYYIAFDFDASTIPIHGEFWEFIKNTLNYIHFPLPGIKISQDGVSFLLVAY